MTDLRTYAMGCISKLGGVGSDDAFHSLIEAEDAVVAFLIEAFCAEPEPHRRALLVNIIWEHRLPETVEFLAEALQDAVPAVWKSALDGLVTLGGTSSIGVLRSARDSCQRGGEKEAAKLRWIDEALEQTAQKE